MILSLLVRAESQWRTVVRGPLGPSDIDPDDIRDDACDVTVPSRLCQPPAEPDPAPSDNSDGGPAFDAPSVGAGGFGQLLVILLIVALVIGIAFLAMRYFGDRGPRQDDADDDVDTDDDLDELVEERVVDHASPPDRWRQRAEQFRSAGDYRESVRCEYRALVGDLARAGHVDEIPGRTSGEERAQVHELAPDLGAAGAGVATQFSAAADIFDAAWFDDDVVTADEDTRFVTASRAVLDVVLESSRRIGARR